MDSLWAPWRIAYVSNNKKQRRCIFCNASRAPTTKSFVVFKTKNALAMLNIYPYNNGHCMVAPLRHVKDLSQLKDNEMLGVMAAVHRINKLLDKTLKPHGYNIGINLAKVAGAGIPGHVHIHIVPRWLGDTNFMPVIAHTKIISQSLTELLKLLKDADAQYYPRD